MTAVMRAINLRNVRKLATRTNLNIGYCVSLWGGLKYLTGVIKECHRKAMTVAVTLNGLMCISLCLFTICVQLVVPIVPKVDFDVHNGAQVDLTLAG